MKNRSLLILGTAVATALVVPSMTMSSYAADATNPGLVPNTGQINTGAAAQPSSQSADVTNMPTPDEARAALMAPISRQPSTGDAPAATTGTGGRDANAGSQPSLDSNTSAEPPPSGPIGSFGQTIPAKFSKRNDTLDRVPTMAIPLPLSDQQRKQIYDAVMADKAQPVADADTLKPASELSPDQALTGMHPLPENVRGIDGVARLYFVKAKDRVLLIEPATRTVVGQITS
jgi:hypothetical protein